MPTWNFDENGDLIDFTEEDPEHCESKGVCGCRPEPSGCFYTPGHSGTHEWEECPG